MLGGSPPRERSTPASDQSQLPSCGSAWFCTLMERSAFFLTPPPVGGLQPCRFEVPCQCPTGVGLISAESEPVSTPKRRMRCGQTPASFFRNGGSEPCQRCRADCGGLSRPGVPDEKGSAQPNNKAYLSKGVSKRPSDESATPLPQALDLIRRALENVAVASILWTVLDALFDAAPPPSLESGSGRISAAIEPPADSR